jgi:hypothetical protein
MAACIFVAPLVCVNVADPRVSFDVAERVDQPALFSWAPKDSKSCDGDDEERKLALVPALFTVHCDTTAEGATSFGNCRSGAVKGITASWQLLLTIFRGMSIVTSLLLASAYVEKRGRPVLQ